MNFMTLNFIRAIYISVLICVMSLLSFAYAQNVTFFSVLPDVPVIAGMNEAKDLAVIFDKPQGRFVEVLMAGDVQDTAVRVYYADVLPQMGWNQASTGEYYTRAGERLDIHFDKNTSQTLVHITISPQ